MANANPPRDIIFKVISLKYMGMNAAKSEIGIASPIMTRGRMCLKKRNRIKIARVPPQRALPPRLPIARLMYSAWSNPVLIVTPSGKCSSISPIFLHTLLHT